MMLAQSLVPGWIVLPMAIITLIVIAVHWVSLGSATMPAVRKRVRSACGLVMLLTVPVLAYGLGIVSTSHPRVFSITWLLVMGLLIVVLLLAIVDMICVWREALADRRALMIQVMATREAVLARTREVVQAPANARVPVSQAPNDLPHHHGRGPTEPS
jgi:hypothetical protein